MEKTQSPANAEDTLYNDEIGTAASYTIDGRRFDVERVFKEDSPDTIGTVLLKLIRLEAGAQ